MKFTEYINKLIKEKNSKDRLRKIAFIEGSSQRMIKAATELVRDQKIVPILIFESTAQKMEANTEGLETIVIGEDQALLEQLTTSYTKKRAGKETAEQARANLRHNHYFAAMLVELGIVDGAIGGVHHPTSDILRAAFKGVGPKAGVKTISSIMMMHRDKDWYIFSDISVNVSPTSVQLYEIARNACDFSKQMNLPEKVAFLSFSTAGSALTPESKKVHEATTMFNKDEKTVDQAIGEVQFDAAIDLKIRASKYKYDASWATKPAIMIFPDLNSGNIGYKIAQRMGNWGAIGPIVTGLNRPINDLSRGATVDDIKYTALITALQAFL